MVIGKLVLSKVLKIDNIETTQIVEDEILINNTQAISVREFLKMAKNYLGTGTTDPQDIIDELHWRCSYGNN